MVLDYRSAVLRPFHLRSSTNSDGISVHIPTQAPTVAPDDDMTDEERMWFSIFHLRRHFDLIGASTGLVLCSAHLALLVYLKVARHGKSYELLIAQAVASLGTLLLLVVGCILDIHLSNLPFSFLYFRAYLWLFLVNSLMATYGYLIVVICLDRYVAMHNPLYYRISFVRRRMRLSLIGGSVVLGCVVCMHWLVVNEVAADGTIDENFKVTDTWHYSLVRTLSYIFKYIVPGVAMVTISVANISFLRNSCRAYSSEEDGCRIAREDSCHNAVNVHTNIARISAFLAVTFILFNWPYAAIDYWYTEDLASTTWYSVLTLIINFLQVVFIQLNLLFFALCSSIYRAALWSILKMPARLAARLVAKGRGAGAEAAHLRPKDERLSTLSGTSENTLFTVC